MSKLEASYHEQSGRIIDVTADYHVIFLAGITEIVHGCKIQKQSQTTFFYNNHLSHIEYQLFYNVKSQLTNISKSGPNQCCL